ncbi:kinase-like domain-containing protein [Scenedesmus sp. NREL 46B-D3]|nr:kinase-like domain-containing protein [Scenedesmus sp. NREL 46B-D3]
MPWLSQLKGSNMAQLSKLARADPKLLDRVLNMQQLVMSGSNWAPYLCALSGEQFLYRTVAGPEDAGELPQDWAALHEVAGLRTFLAVQVTVPGQGVVGVLCLASRSAGAFMEGSWGPLLSMAATGLVPCLASPWLAGLSGLAAGLADVASMDGFTGFAAGFLQGAGQLLGSVTNRHLGVRLGLLGEAGEELLLLQPSVEPPSNSTAQQHGSDALALTGEPAATSQLFRANSSSSSPELGLPQVHMARLAAAGTLLLQAVHSRQPCSMLDVRAAMQADRDAVPLDVLLADASEPLGSVLVLPLFSGSGRALGGLYLVHGEAGGLLDGGRLRERVAVLQQLLQQEIADMEVGLEEVQACKSHLIRSCSCLSSSSYSSSVSGTGSCASVASCASRNAELGVLQKQWQMQDKQQACASSYLSELQLHSVLGEGGFGTVYAGSWMGARTAVKVMRLSPDDKLGIPAKSAMEMAALSTLRHPNIVTCYACLTDMVQERLPAALDLSRISSSTSLRQQQGPLGIRFRPASESDLSDSAVDSFNILVMERCDRGNLSDAVCFEGLLHRRGPDGVLRVSMGLLYTVLLDVAAALRYMHSLGLVHLDVKASNVLLQTTSGRLGGFPVAKLGDLGLVKLLGKGGSLVNRSTSGTLTHLAPERLQEGSLITPAADAYSFGMLMYELYTGQQPYSGLAPGPELMRAVFDGLRPRLPDSTPPGYTALAEACWSRHTSQRPSLEEIVARLQELLDQTRKLAQLKKRQ